MYKPSNSLMFDKTVYTIRATSVCELVRIRVNLNQDLGCIYPSNYVLHSICAKVWFRAKL